MKFNKFELSLAVGLLAALLYCALEPRLLAAWWCAAFEPLCGDLLTAGDGGELLLRSFFAERLASLFS